jgi:biopolymer transport protein ExbB/TolQ
LAALPPAKSIKQGTDALNAINRLYQSLFSSPLLWGAMGAVGFYALIEAGPLDYPVIRRYFMGHAVEYMETIIFAIGLALLVMKSLDLLGQFARFDRPLFEESTQVVNPRLASQTMLDQLAALPEPRRSDSLARRFRGALMFISNRGSAEGLDDELKYIADADSTRNYNSYGLFRVIVWAIPILGFLGTVVGITVALNSVDLKAPDESLVHVLTGLGLKFDTTALALSLSMVLMFLYCFVDRAENALLERVDVAVSQEMSNRFPSIPAGPEGHLLVIRRMAETVVQATEQLVGRQAELWQASMEAAATRWAQQAEVAGQQLQSAFGGAIEQSLRAPHEHTVAAMAALQETVARQVEMLEKTVKATGEVVTLEDALNRNLAALSGARNFEQTVVSLAAAVNLLSGRLSDAPAPPVRLEPSRKAARAA